MTRSALPLAAFALAATTALLITVAPAAALVAETDDAAAWELRPVADEAGQRTSIELQLEDKAAVSDSLVLVNTGDTAEDFILKASDATNDATGLLVLQPAARTASEAGSWIELPEEPIRLEPGAEITVPFTIDLPPDATSGDHVAGIIAGHVSESGSIDLASAVASPIIWVSMRIDGVLDPALTVARTTAAYNASWNPLAAGDVDVSYTVANSGNATMDVERTVIVSGPLGLELARIEQEPILSLLPGQFVDVTEQVTGIPALGMTWTRVETVTSEPGTVLGAEEEPETPSPTATPEPTESAAPSAEPTPTESAAPGAAQTSTNYTATYPTASGGATAVSISWMLTALVILAIAAITIGRRAVTGTRERHYLAIDEALAARAAAAAADAPAAQGSAS